MSKTRWKTSRLRLGGFPAIELAEPQGPGEAPELALAGNYGEIWQSAPGQYRAVITSARIARRYLPEAQRPVLPGDETLILFPEADLPLWASRLKVPRERAGQARRANSFGQNGADGEFPAPAGSKLPPA